MDSFLFAQVLGQAATSTSEDFQPNSLAGFAAQAVTYVLGLGLFPMYLDGKRAPTPSSSLRPLTCLHWDSILVEPAICLLCLSAALAFGTVSLTLPLLSNLR